MLRRIAFSIAAILVYGWVNFLANPIATIASGQLAGKQFETSNTAYVQSVIGFRFFGNFGIPAVVLIAVLAAIWWKYISKAKKTTATGAVVLAIITLTATPRPVQAYHDKVDRAEVVWILPNQSAFWVPDVGDNKSSQAKFMSEQYLRDQKIAAKRFQIPHVKLENSAALRDYYVPAGRLIIVDRTPQAREWVAANNRGTSQHNESFPCQSSEGINMQLGVSIGVSVLEEDSPLFLYRFGVYQDTKDASDPDAQFKSVYYGRSLAEITDAVVRRKAQTVACGEVGTLSFDNANKQMPAIMTSMEKEMRTYLKSVGVTLDFIGWADTVTFDPEIQKAVNDAYRAQKLAPQLATLERLANLETKLKWDGKLPQYSGSGATPFIQLNK
jgi:hypothetical protein